MSEKETVQSLISYLQALSEVSRNSEVKVFAEIQRTIGKIEKLINQ